MACFCFKAPPTEENLPKQDTPKVPTKRSFRSGPLAEPPIEATIPSKPQHVASTGKQAPVDRESPVSVLSGPGDDVSSDQRKPSYSEQEQQQQSVKHLQEYQRLQQQQQQQPQHGFLTPPLSKSRIGESRMADSCEVAVGSGTMDSLMPRGMSIPDSAAQDVAGQKRRSSEIPHLPGRQPDPLGRSSSPLPSQKLNLQKDREHSFLQQQLRHQQQQQQQLVLDSAKDPYERQRLKHQQQQVRGAGSCYASSLPGKSRILAWLDESDLSFATVSETDNTPYPVHGDLSPIAAGKFLSSLKMGYYEDLAGKAVTRDVLIKRGMQRAQLLPDSASPSDVSDGPRCGMRGEALPGSTSHQGAKAHRPPISPLPQGTSSGLSGAAVDGSDSGVSGPGFSSRQALGGAVRHVRSLDSVDGPEGGVGESTVTTQGSASAAGNGAGNSNGLLRKAQALLPQRSLDAEGKGRRLGGGAGGVGSNQQHASEQGNQSEGASHRGSHAQMDGDGDDGREGSDEEEEDAMENRGGQGGKGMRPPMPPGGRSNPPSAPVTPLHQMLQGGGSSLAMSPALGVGGSTDVGSRGMAPTPDELSDLGRDSTGESPNSNSR